MPGSRLSLQNSDVCVRNDDIKEGHGGGVTYVEIRRNGHRRQMVPLQRLVKEIERQASHIASFTGFLSPREEAFST